MVPKPEKGMGDDFPEPDAGTRERVAFAVLEPVPNRMSRPSLVHAGSDGPASVSGKIRGSPRGSSFSDSGKSSSWEMLIPATRENATVRPSGERAGPTSSTFGRGLVSGRTAPVSSDTTNSRSNPSGSCVPDTIKNLLSGDQHNWLVAGP